jgi:hypothetical protein
LVTKNKYLVNCRFTQTSKCIFFSLSVHVDAVERNDGGGRVYNKKLACYYCGKLYNHRIWQHIEAVHDDEADVCKAAAMKGKEKDEAVAMLKNMGNYKYNIAVLSEEKGQIIVSRRSKESGNAGDYLPCIHCVGFFKVRDLWRHSKVCKLNKEKDDDKKQTSILVRSVMLLAGGLLPEDFYTFNNPQFKVLHDLVLQTGRRDGIYDAVNTDPLILRFGSVLIKKLGPRRGNDIMQRMRQLGRLRLELNRRSSQSQEGRICDKKLTEYISGHGFDEIIGAVESLAGLKTNEHGISTFTVPSLPLRLGHNLLKCAELKRGMALRNQDDQMLKSSEIYIKLHLAEWTDKISSIALATLKTNKFNQPTMLPVTSDLLKLRNYLELEMSDLVQTLQEGPSRAVWKSLAKVMLARLIIFNKRRSSEVSKLLEKTYATRPEWRNSMNEEILQNLDEVEKELLGRYAVAFSLYSSSLMYISQEISLVS